MSSSDSPPFIFVRVHFQDKMVKDIDYLGIHKSSAPGGVEIVQVYVSVQQISGAEHPHEPEHAFEPRMTQVRLVMNTPRRSVGQQNVEKTTVNKTIPDESGNKPEHPQVHLKFRELVLSVVVPHAAAQSGNQQSLHATDPVFQIGCTVVISQLGRH